MLLRAYRNQDSETHNTGREFKGNECHILPGIRI